MSYKVVFLRGAQDVGSSPWMSKDLALEHAKDQFPFRRRRLGVTAVYVVDRLTDEVVFSFPALAPDPSDDISMRAMHLNISR
jgi:hypothetical protein